MKTKLTMIAVLLFTFGAMAQQGSWYIGGMAGYGSKTAKDNDNTDKSTSWNFSPEVGTFLKDDIQLGIALNISGTSADENNFGQGDGTKSTSSLAPVLYARKFWTLIDKLSVFSGLNLKYTSTTMEDFSDPTMETKMNGFGADINIGIALGLGERFAALGSYGLLGYSTMTTDDGNGNDLVVSDFGFNVNTLGPVFNIGLYYTFCKGKKSE